ncbi:hypothetical protein UPYG_G00304240 [Umbra pygmaea]|uniref:IRG-type G domain-containing protein n=1 Tax=Umbra pygmaea TaxID=75934 RepID=A0ABD0WHW9_UMBPY
MSRLLSISEAEVVEMTRVLRSRVVTDVVTQVQDMLNQLDSATLNIAVTGETGSGKSSFVNAFCGVAADAPGAARTGVTETTLEATAYSHPRIPRVTLWDLPGIGTPAFQPETYLEHVGLLQYDFFIIIAAGRFKEHHVQLARAITEAGKRFYFIWNKVDNDLDASFRRRSSKGVTEADVLGQIREGCEGNLRRAGLQDANVFLLSCFQLQSFDFPRLQATVVRELESHKRHVFLLSLPNLSSAVVEEKKMALRGAVWRRAIEACLTTVTTSDGCRGAVPLLMTILTSYQRSFGLDSESLQQLATLTGNSYQVLQKNVHSTTGQELSEMKVQAMLNEIAATQQTVASYLEERVPVLGTVASSGVVFAASFYLLTSALNDLSQDATRVMNVALGLSVTG